MKTLILISIMAPLAVSFSVNDPWVRPWDPTHLHGKVKQITEWHYEQKPDTGNKEIIDSFSYTYMYDEKGRLIHEKSMDGKIRYEFNSNDQCIKEYNESYNALTTYQCDSKGEVVSDSIFKPDGTLDGHNFYTHDAEGRCTAHILIDRQNGKETIESFVYDRQGNTTLYISSVDGHRDTAGRQYKYDDHGHMIERISVLGEDTSDIFMYNQNEDMIQQVHFDIHGKRELVTDLKRYDYDSAGNWIRRINTVDGNIILKREIEYYP